MRRKRKTTLWQTFFIKDTSVRMQGIVFALIALLLSVLIFSYSAYRTELDKYETRYLYLQQLGKEISLNLNFIDIYQENLEKAKQMRKDQGQVATWASTLPIVPITTVYESGLQNGNIYRLPVDTQNSLAWAFSAAKRVAKYSDDLHVADLQNNEVRYAVDNLEVENHTGNFKENLEAVYDRGFYYAYDPTDYMNTMKYTSYGIASIVVLVILYDFAAIIYNRFVRKRSLVDIIKRKHHS